MTDINNSEMEKTEKLIEFTDHLLKDGEESIVLTDDPEMRELQETLLKLNTLMLEGDADPLTMKIMKAKLNKRMKKIENQPNNIFENIISIFSINTWVTVAITMIIVGVYFNTGENGGGGALVGTAQSIGSIAPIIFLIVIAVVLLFSKNKK